MAKGFWDGMFGRKDGGKDAKGEKAPEQKESTKAVETKKLWTDWRTKVDDYRRRDAAGEVIDGDKVFDDFNRLYRVYNHAFEFYAEPARGFFVTLNGVKKNIDEQLRLTTDVLHAIDSQFPDLTGVEYFPISPYAGLRGPGVTFWEKIQGAHSVDMGILRDEIRRAKDGRSDKKHLLQRALNMREEALVDRQLYAALQKDFAVGAFSSKADVVRALDAAMQSMAEDWEYLDDLFKRSPAKAHEQARSFFDGEGDAWSDEQPVEKKKELGVDYYAVLGVTREASGKEIRRAFHALAKEVHPDLPGGDEEAFKKIRDAFEVLSDDGKRMQYDKTGKTK